MPGRTVSLPHGPELFVWIHDLKNGVGNVKSDALLLMWDKFRALGIEIPCSQRDLHLKTPMEVKVATRLAAYAIRVGSSCGCG